jgi:hypothetical protein
MEISGERVILDVVQNEFGGLVGRFLKLSLSSADSAVPPGILKNWCLSRHLQIEGIRAGG